MDVVSYKMSKFIDLTGKVFGRWTVIKRVENAKWGGSCWLCRCECGVEKVVFASGLRNGNSKSCGCLMKDLNVERTQLPQGQASFNALYRKYKYEASKRGYVFELTKEQFEEITKGNCYYCGAEPKQIWGTPAYNGYYIYNGVDRVDNNKGYIVGNVVSCCGVCNIQKGMMTKEEFIDHAKDIANLWR